MPYLRPTFSKLIKTVVPAFRTEFHCQFMVNAELTSLAYQIHPRVQNMNNSKTCFIHGVCAIDENREIRDCLSGV